MAYAPVAATLGYVLSPDRRSVLMVHRNARPSDHAFGKYNGLGGKMEPDEDLAACMIREIREEAGIEAPPCACGGRSPGRASGTTARAGSASCS